MQMQTRLQCGFISGSKSRFLLPRLNARGVLYMGTVVHSRAQSYSWRVLVNLQTTGIRSNFKRLKKRKKAKKA